MSRKCSKCKRSLNETEFNWKIKGIKLSYHCKECSRSYIRSHYRKNLNYYLKKSKKRNLEIRRVAHAFLGPYLLSHPCVDCGEKDILVLEFDHKDRKLKEFEIRRIIQNGGSVEKIKSEIRKCEIRCANCHRRKTEIENRSWKLKFAPVA